MNDYVYAFREGNADMRNLLGGKGANLAEMTNLGLPIPQGFTVTTEACTDYYNNGKKISEEIQNQMISEVKNNNVKMLMALLATVLLLVVASAGVSAAGAGSATGAGSAAGAGAAVAVLPFCISAIISARSFSRSSASSAAL